MLLLIIFKYGWTNCLYFYYYIIYTQSTYCSSLYRHCETMQRSIHIVNLDPAAENFDYPVAMGELVGVVGLIFLALFC